MTDDEPGVDGRTPAIELRAIRKAFDGVVAVDDIDLTVPRVSFFGLVGPNGAGKTTSLSILTGLLAPDAGSARILGVDVQSDPVPAKRSIGVLSDGAQMFDRLTGEQLVVHAGMLHGIPRATARSRALDLFELLELTPSASKLVVDYSEGMRKKVAIAAALVHAPRVLILDEPFESVDPVSAVNIRGILQDFVAGSGTVLVSSHSMDLVERMCDRVAVVASGRILAVGTIDEVRAGLTLEQRFVNLVGGRTNTQGPAWLRQF